MACTCRSRRFRARGSARSRSRRAARPSRRPGGRSAGSAGPADLVDAVLAVKQFLTYVNGSPVPARDRDRAAPARRLLPTASPRRCGRKRDLLGAGLRAAGFDVSVPAGSYFTVADAAPLGATDAAEFCRALPDRAGVVAIPLTAFVASGSDGRSTRRSCGSPRASASTCSRRRHPASRRSRLIARPAVARGDAA